MTTTTKYCPTCEAEREVRDENRVETYDVRGEKIGRPVTAEVCTVCNETIFDEARDQALLLDVYAEYRRRRGLSFPHEIKATRGRFDLSQKSFATLLGMSEATINRYEQGGLQEDSHDTAIRFASSPEAMASLIERRGHLLSERQRQWAQTAIERQQPKPLRCFMWQMPVGISDQTGGRAFDFDRYAAVVVWFCRDLDEVLRTKLNKLLFYADFLSFKHTGRSITGAAYKRLPYGPVPADFGGLQDALEADDFIVTEEGTYGDGFDFVQIRPGPAAPSSVDLSRSELAALKYVADTFRAHGSKSISERSHKEAAWLHTAPKALISYSHAATLSLWLPTETGGNNVG